MYFRIENLFKQIYSYLIIDEELFERNMIKRVRSRKFRLIWISNKEKKNMCTLYTTVYTYNMKFHSITSSDINVFEQLILSTFMAQARWYFALNGKNSLPSNIIDHFESLL